MYELPGQTQRLMLLLRSGGSVPGEPPVGSHMLASTCELAQSDADDGVVTDEALAQALETKKDTYHVCRPGTGLWNVGLPGDRMPKHPPSMGTEAGSKGVGVTAQPWPGYRPIPVGRHCNWSAPVVTAIPDSHSRACTAPLPDGRIFMVRNGNGYQSSLTIC